jgi:hypothetical protein
MELQDLIRLCDEYDSLGHGAQGLLDQMLGGDSFDEMGSDARHYLPYAANFLDFVSGYDVAGAAELYDKVTDYLESLDKKEG